MKVPLIHSFISSDFSKKVVLITCGKEPPAVIVIAWFRVEELRFHVLGFGFGV